MPGTPDEVAAPDDLAALRAQCTAFLAGHGPVTPADLLADIPADTVPDRYGDGGVVAGLEAEVAGLLGKPAAAYLPSGTMVCPGGSLRSSGTPTSMTKQPPGARCAAALPKHATCASCVVRFMIVLNTR